MSGGGGGYSSYNNDRNISPMGGVSAHTGGSIDTGSKCHLIFITQLASAQPKAVANIQVGDLLKVEISSSNGAVVVCLDKNHTIVGTIAPACIEELINCLEQGFEYQAEILSINQGYVELKVYPT